MTVFRTPPRHRVRDCPTLRAAYSTHAMASFAMQVLRMRYDSRVSHAYECTTCGMWHLSREARS